MKILLLSMVLAVSGCALLPTGGFDPASLPLSKFTHADLQAAAAYANANGFPARAAVYTAIDIQLTACETAIASASPKPVPTGTTVGAFTLFEVAAEQAATGIPSAVKINCSAVTLPTL